MKKPVITLLHIGYWLVYVLLLLVILLSLKAGTNLSKSPLFLNYRLDIFLSALTIVPAIVGFYIFYSVLFSKLLEKKKLLIFFPAAFAASFAGAFAGMLCLFLLSLLQVGNGIFTDGFASALPAIFIMAIIALLNGVVGLVMKGFITWYGDIKLKEELAQKNYETELALVKSQLDPHFLFNTINNIDVLIEKNPATASHYLNKLSHIMRFMLYETKTEKIPLQKELEYIEKYIELQKIRNANPDFVHYKVNSNYSELMIPPMLFIPFIENAFKHSENRKMENAVHISFDISAGAINFECKNTCGKNNLCKQAYSGLGNELIQKRLSLLYPEKHTLSISNSNEMYNVKLEINCH